MYESCHLEMPELRERINLVLIPPELTLYVVIHNDKGK